MWCSAALRPSALMVGLPSLLCCRRDAGEEGLGVCGCRGSHEGGGAPPAEAAHMAHVGRRAGHPARMPAACLPAPCLRQLPIFPEALRGMPLLRTAYNCFIFTRCAVQQAGG